MRVEMWIDPVCPYSYIGKRLFDQALERFSHQEHIHITYKSYLLYEDALRVQQTDIVDQLFVDWDCSNREERINQLYTCAEIVGLKDAFSTAQQPINTLNAHRLIKYAAQNNKEEQMVNRLLEAHFFEHQSIEQIDCLLKLGEEIGLLDTEVIDLLHSCKFTTDVRNDTEEAKELGVGHIPFLIINETCGIQAFHTPEQFVYILNTLWDENGMKATKQPSRKTTYCTAEGCHEIKHP